MGWGRHHELSKAEGRVYSATEAAVGRKVWGRMSCLLPPAPCHYGRVKRLGINKEEEGKHRRWYGRHGSIRHVA